MWLVISTAFSTMKDFSRLQAFVYTKKFGNILEIVQDKSRCYYRPPIASNIWPMEERPFCDLQSHSPIESLFKCDYLYSFAAADKISPDMM